MHLGDRIKRLEVLLSREVNARLRSCGLTMQQQSALHIVHEREEEGRPACQRDLEEALGLSNPTVTGLCKRLEIKGLIRRERDGVDGRVWRLRTTQEDEKLRARLLGEIEQVEAGLSAGMTGEEKRFLGELLAKIEENLEQMHQSEGGDEDDPNESEL